MRNNYIGFQRGYVWLFGKYWCTDIVGRLLSRLANKTIWHKWYYYYHCCWKINPTVLIDRLEIRRHD